MYINQTKLLYYYFIFFIVLIFSLSLSVKASSPPYQECSSDRDCVGLVDKKPSGLSNSLFNEQWAYSCEHKDDAKLILSIPDNISRHQFMYDSQPKCKCEEKYHRCWLVNPELNSSPSNTTNNAVQNQNFIIIEDVTQAVGVTEMQVQKEDENNKDNNRGQINAETHRSAVANFIQSLLSVADREGGIGKQVRIIAQEQNESKEITAEAIDKVEKRSKIKTLLFGTDYKNIGALRSEMVKTRNLIDQLNRLADQATTEQNKSELQAQIQNLKQEESDINNFIIQNEEQFSLFGWAVKLFVK